MIENDDGSKREVLCNEFKCVMGASLGRRNPTEAGIRIGKEKFLYIKTESDTQSTYLSRTGGGGAVIAKLKDGLVIGIWHKDIVMSKGGNQNMADCAMNVEKLGNFLREAGY
jgi:hypothetical protein